MEPLGKAHRGESPVGCTNTLKGRAGVWVQTDDDILGIFFLLWREGGRARAAEIRAFGNREWGVEQISY